jgi:cytosine deaminase
VSGTPGDADYLAAAVRAARQGLAEGGIPIGAALIVDGGVLATGWNKRVQLGSAIRHGENQTFYGGEDLLRARGVEVTVLDDPECVAMMTAFIADRPSLWNEDIGVPD